MKKEVSLKKLCCTAITATNLQIMLLESRSLLALCMSNSIKSLTEDSQFKDEKIFVNDKSDTDSYTMELYTNACSILRIGIKISLSKDCSRITPIIMYEVSDRALELNKVIKETTKAYC